MVIRKVDVILKDYNTIRMFIYADLESKMNRCMLKEEKGENLTKEELVKN